MKRIRWSPAAADDLANIRDYLSDHHPTLMQPSVRKLYDAAHSLKSSPHRGRLGKKSGVHGVEPEMVHILRVIHTSRDWPQINS